MMNIGPFGNALEAVDQLPVEQQEELIDIVKNRLRERRRDEVLANIREAEAELAAGKAKVMTVDEIMREALE